MPFPRPSALCPRGHVRSRRWPGPPHHPASATGESLALREHPESIRMLIRCHISVQIRSTACLPAGRLEEGPCCPRRRSTSPSPVQVRLEHTHTHTRTTAPPVVYPSCQSFAGRLEHTECSRQHLHPPETMLNPKDCSTPKREEPAKVRAKGPLPGGSRSSASQRLQVLRTAGLLEPPGAALS